MEQIHTWLDTYMQNQFWRVAIIIGLAVLVAILLRILVMPLLMRLSRKTASNMDDRAKRANDPAADVPSVTTGISMCQSVSEPELGKIRSESENRRINRIPRKKFGMLKPKTEKLITKRSIALLRLSAATSPKGTPSRMLTNRAVIPSCKVAGTASSTTSTTSRSSDNDIPRSPFTMPTK